MIRGILLDVAPPLFAYYGLRAVGVSTVFDGHRAVRRQGQLRRSQGQARRPVRRVPDADFGLSLAVGVATSDARLLLAGNTLVNGIGGLFFLGSCAIGKPLTKGDCRACSAPTATRTNPARRSSSAGCTFCSRRCGVSGCYRDGFAPHRDTHAACRRGQGGRYGDVAGAGGAVHRGDDRGGQKGAGPMGTKEPVPG